MKKDITNLYQLREGQKEFYNRIKVETGYFLCEL